LIGFTDLIDCKKERIVAECTATLDGEYNERLKIFMGGFLKDERVGYAIVTRKTTIKNRMRSQTAIFSAEQEAIIKAICISKGKGATVCLPGTPSAQ
jgi:glutamate mutase epsilon subunit